MDTLRVLPRLPGVTLLAGVAIAVACGASPGTASEAPLWGTLDTGPYAVGFEVRETFDQTRSFLDKRDASGRVRQVERTRPVQIAIWYPAADPKDQVTGGAMHFGDYVTLQATETSFGPVSEDLLETIRRGYLAQANAVGLDEETARAILSLPVAARRGVPHAEGRHPLVLYAPGFGASSDQAAVLGEYLASHGYVVASSPSMGARSRRMIGGPLGLETQTRDLEHVLATLRGDSFVDRDRVAAIGFSFGGGAVTLLEMRNGEVDAVVVYDGIEAFRDHPALAALRASPWFEARNMDAPRLRLHVGDRDRTDLSLYKEMVYSERFVVDLPRLVHGHFSTAAMTSDWVHREKRRAPTQGRVGYELVCRATRIFLEGWLKDDEGAREALREGLRSLDRPEDFLHLHHHKGRPAPPSEAQFLELLERRGFEEARRRLREIQKTDSGYVPFSEQTMNVLGYSLLWEGRTKEALGAFQLNVEAYPESWNVYDSLGEAYARIGETEKAIRNYRRSLELEPRNENAERWLDKLAGR